MLVCGLGVGTGTGWLRMESAGGEKWIDALARWKKEGRKEVTPGLGDDIAAGKNAAEGRDYTGEAGYYLRPEASLSLWIDTGDLLTMTCVFGRRRLLRACISCGRRRSSPGFLTFPQSFNVYKSVRG